MSQHAARQGSKMVSKEGLPLAIAVGGAGLLAIGMAVRHIVADPVSPAVSTEQMPCMLLC